MCDMRHASLFSLSQARRPCDAFASWHIAVIVTSHRSCNALRRSLGCIATPSRIFSALRRLCDLCDAFAQLRLGHAVAYYAIVGVGGVPQRSARLRHRGSRRANATPFLDMGADGRGMERSGRRSVGDWHWQSGRAWAPKAQKWAGRLVEDDRTCLPPASPNSPYRLAISHSPSYFDMSLSDAMYIPTTFFELTGTPRLIRLSRLNRLNPPGGSLFSWRLLAAPDFSWSPGRLAMCSIHNAGGGSSLVDTTVHRPLKETNVSVRPFVQSLIQPNIRKDVRPTSASMLFWSCNGQCSRIPFFRPHTVIAALLSLWVHIVRCPCR